LRTNIIYNEDCLIGMKKLPDESIDLIITDPPFMISQEIKIGRSANTKYAASKDINLDFGPWDNQWKTEKEYYNWCYKWLKECVRVLKPYKHLLFFFDKKKVTPVWEYLERLGMKGRSPLYWIKSNPVPRARKVDFMKAIEMTLWFTKKSIKQDFFNWKLGQAKDYIIDAIPNNPRLHPTQKPEKPIEQWINYLSNKNNIVFDPFVGSGTTLVVAKKLGRQYLGFEINKEYYEIAKKRIATTVYQKEFEFEA